MAQDYTLAKVADPSTNTLSVMSDQLIVSYAYEAEDIVFHGSEDSTSYYALMGTEPLFRDAIFTFYRSVEDMFELWGSVGTDECGEYRYQMAVKDKSTGTKVGVKTIRIVIYNNWYADFKYNLNGASGTAPAGFKDNKNNKTSKPSKTITITSDIPTMSGFTFEGWSKTQYTPGTGTAEYHAGDSYEVKYQAMSYPTDDILYAVWSGTPTNVHVKQNGEWKTGVAYVKQGDTWKQATKVFGKKDGSWRS